MKKTYLLTRILKPDLHIARKVTFALVLYLIGINFVYSQGPNCEEFIPGIDYDGNSFFYVHEFLSNEPELPVRLTIRNNGQEIVHESQHYNYDDIVSFNICPYLQDSLQFRVENDESYCESKIYVGIPPKPYMNGRYTTVFCSDSIVKNEQPIDSIYPDVIFACGVEPKVTFSSDWVDKYDCEDYDNDTLKVIYREFEGFDKYKRRFATQDTIVVLKVPEITDSQFICAENDTLFCGKADDFGPKFFYENPITGENDTISMVDVTIGSNKILEFNATSYLEECGIQYSVQSELIDNTKCEKRYRVEVEFSQNCYFSEPGLMRRNKGLSNLGKGKYRCVFWALDRDTLAPSILIEDLVITNKTTTHNCEAPIEFPAIKIEDKWAGVRHAKADVRGEFTVELTKQGDFWKPVEKRFLPVGGQTYEHFSDKLMSDFENAMDRNFSDSYRKYTDPISCIPFSLVGNGKAKLSLQEGICSQSLTVNTYGSSEPVALEVPLQPRAPDNSVIKVAVDVYTDNPFTLRGYDMYNNWVHHDSVIEQPLGCGRVRKIYEFSDSVEYIRMSALTGSFSIDNFNYSITTKIENAYKVIVEGKDSCNLMAQDSFYIIVKDKTEPTVACDKDIVVGLTGKLTWVDANIFDEGSYDNCGIYTILGRRKNWANSCGVNLCDGLETDKRINPVEAHYAEFVDWLKYDGEPCSEMLYEQWQLDSAYYCPKTDEHGNVIKGKKPTLGGGWTEKIPFCCEDACGEVDIELLVVDYWCNWTICWTTVKVEDKQGLSVIQDIERELTISCASYSENYQDLVEKALMYNGDEFENTDRVKAFDDLDEVFGGYEEVWKNIDGYLVDKEGGNVVPSEYTTTVKDIRCENYSKKEKVAIYNEHTGKYDWVEEYIPAVKKEETEIQVRNGIIAVNCSVSVYQDLWVDLDDCGTGTIRRRFFIVSGCNESINGGKKLRDTVYKEQKIIINQDCEISLGMFNLPTREISKEVCSFEKDQLGNYSGDLHPEETGRPDFIWNQSCKSLEISYEDKLFNLVGSNQKADYKLIRTWEIKDWCGSSSGEHGNVRGKTLEYEQKIIITEVEECNDSSGFFSIAGKITNTAMKPMKDVNLTFHSGGEIVGNVKTNEVGNYHMELGESMDITVVPERKTDMMNGITTFDIILIHQHILNKNILSGQYKKVAADINQNGRIDWVDVMQLRKIMLNPESFLPYSNGYRFFESTTGNEYGIAESGEVSTFNMDFTGVKIGDVDFSYMESSDNSRGRNLSFENVVDGSSFIFNIKDRVLNPGKIYKIPVTAGNVDNILGFQFELQGDEGAVSSLNILPGVLQITSDNYSFGELGKLYVSWSDARGVMVNQGDVLFTAEVQVNERKTVQSLFQLGNSVLAPESYIEPGIVQGLDVRIMPDHMEGSRNFVNHAPNPFSEETVISFELDEEEMVKFSVYDMAGKAIISKEINGSRGMNSEVIFGEALPASGIYFYEIKSSSIHRINKVVFIKR
ncbi:T9SS type A sorting domain-containing protein [Membranihabitans maritimus]|uniref:T9SS type A sorting domain-containing protein n=1 Tax=Membranihabitans maritimus TaxID=2904244 RepID=UPI001F334241|nr:T9SS type A sorting domain-containing protein [Membranihabitans maritimus]